MKPEHKQLMLNISIRMRELRIIAGLTVNQVADKLGVSKSSVADYEHFRSHISVPLLIAYQEILGCSLDELLGKQATSAEDLHIKRLEAAQLRLDTARKEVSVAWKAMSAAIIGLNKI